MSRRFGSLRVRLPTTVALLLAACTGVATFVAYRSVRASALSAASERVHSGTDRLANALATGNGSFRRPAVDVSRLNALIPGATAWITAGTGGSSVLSALDSVHRASPRALRALIIERHDGQRISVGDSLAVTRAAALQGAMVSPLFAIHDTVVNAVAQPILGAGHDTIARFITVQPLGTTAVSTLFGDLIAKGAVVRIGNADGSLWSDFAAPTKAPDGVAAKPDLGHANVSTPTTVASLVPIRNTPLVLWIGQPTTDAIETASAVVRRIALICVIVILLGTAVAWWTMYRLTNPLNELASSADALAHGAYDSRVRRMEGDDEVARTARAFNTMADEIAHHHRELEGLVADRTATLEQAMTELRVAQAENVKRERLAVLGQLAGGVGHELRNPLGVMTNAVYVLETVLPRDNPMVGEYLGILKGQIALSEKIVADLLDYARTKPAQRTPNSVSSIVRHQMSRLGPAGNVTVSSEIPDWLREVNVDAVQIGQVVFNLLTNAVQATGTTGGTVTCRADERGDGLLALEVADTGPGIPDDVAARIFEPLFTTKARGLGLGLTVSRMLAENNGGTLTFTTAPGQGTTFTLAMPVARA